MNHNEKILAWLLRLGGAVMLTALAAMDVMLDDDADAEEARG